MEDKLICFLNYYYYYYEDDLKNIWMEANLSFLYLEDNLDF